MTKSEKQKLNAWVKALSDEQLEEEFYKNVFASLGSQTEAMYELGYDLQDIREQEALEKAQSYKVSVLEKECGKRNISLWEPKNEN